MDTSILKTVDGKDYNKFNEQVIPCSVCGLGTTMLGTELCDRCWELDTRIRADLDIAERLVNYYKCDRRYVKRLARRTCESLKQASENLRTYHSDAPDSIKTDIELLADDTRQLILAIINAENERG